MHFVHVWKALDALCPLCSCNIQNSPAMDELRKYLVLSGTFCMTDVWWQYAAQRHRGYWLLLGVCLRMFLRLRAYVRMHERVLLSYVARYLTCAILHKFAAHILHATIFVCVHSGGSMSYLCVCCLDSPSLCIWSQFHGWMSLECSGYEVFRIIRNYGVLLNCRGFTVASLRILAETRIHDHTSNTTP